jgi:predicted amidohydrolase YtcJ
LRTLRQAGVDVAINTDHMFGLDRDDALNPFNPFLTIYAATTRRTESGSGHWRRRGGLASGGPADDDEHRRAIQLRREDPRSIERGKLADFVVLDDDFLTCTPTACARVRPDLTVIDGRIAYDRSAK